MADKVIPKGQSPEEAFGGGPGNQPGVYKHDKAGVELIALSSPAADAFVRLGYERTGPVPRATIAKLPPQRTEEVVSTDDSNNKKESE